MKCPECNEAEMKVTHRDHVYVESGLPDVVCSASSSARVRSAARRSGSCRALRSSTV